MALALFGSRVAQAEVSLQECAAAYAKGQEERLGGRYLSAKEQFQICADLSCPASVVKDCENWHAQVDVVIPSVVPSAIDDEGHRIFDFVLSIDGEVVEVPPAMEAIRLDVGSHVLRFEAEGHAPQEVTVDLKEGQREVAVRATLIAQDRSAPASSVPEERPTKSLSSREAGAIAIGGVGVLVLGVSGYVGLRASKEFRDYKDSCSPSCTPDQADSVRRKIVVSDVALGVGAALLATGAVLYFVPNKSEPRAAVSLKPEAFGASAALNLKF